MQILQADGFTATELLISQLFLFGFFRNTKRNRIKFEFATDSDAGLKWQTLLNSKKVIILYRHRMFFHVSVVLSPKF